MDYDPGASEVNQLNRIKLMISVAKENFREARGAAAERVDVAASATLPLSRAQLDRIEAAKAAAAERAASETEE